MDTENCKVCDKEIVDPDDRFYDRDFVCSNCWYQWGIEQNHIEKEYWNSRL